MILSVSKDQDGKTGLFELSVNDIIFFEALATKDKIVFHTRSDKYFSPGTLKYWVEALKASGEDFELVDRNNVVHLSKVRRVDKFFRKAYFDEEKDSKFCTISISNVSKVIQSIRITQR